MGVIDNIFVKYLQTIYLYKVEMQGRWMYKYIFNIQDVPE